MSGVEGAECEGFDDGNAAVKAACGKQRSKPFIAKVAKEIMAIRDGYQHVRVV
jgi:hypothetical protein